MPTTTPTANGPRCSGAIPGTDATWQVVNSSLQSGFRGFDGGSSLSQLLHECRGHTPQAMKPKLSIEQILDWADQYYAVNEKWPSLKSGKIQGTHETWCGIGHVKGGGRGLPAGSTLGQLFKETPRDIRC